ncbi:hypothetical protein N8349_03570 [Gammaproteobacteria bacterium]|nr:hypothetical protein [Gammaproteobacteria bacterium]
MPKRLTTEEFIRRAKKIHRDKYDYSMGEYKNYHNNLKILCVIHGEFFQSPANHLKGHGCMECGGKRKLTLTEFIDKANKKHSFRYTYENSVYKKNDVKIEITCTKHGSFYMTPHNHLAGQNCPVCSKESKVRTQRLTSEEFIKRAKIIHQNEYDYRNTRYKNYDTAIEIICSKHGSFFQEASNHLQGKGCNKCYGNIAYTNKSFIKKANKVHKNLYDYSSVDYSNNSTGVVISCDTHGQFLQTPANHLRGQGCPSCGKEINTLGDTLVNVRRGKKYLPGILYVIEIYDEKEHFYKVGITSNSVTKRYRNKKLMPYDYETLLEADIGMIDAYENESYLLQEYSKYKYMPKRKFNGKEECLSINPIEHDERLKEYCNYFTV